MGPDLISVGCLKVLQHQYNDLYSHSLRDAKNDDTQRTGTTAATDDPTLSTGLAIVPVEKRDPSILGGSKMYTRICRKIPSFPEWIQDVVEIYLKSSKYQDTYASFLTERTGDFLGGVEGRKAVKDKKGFSELGKAALNTTIEGEDLKVRRM